MPANDNREAEENAKDLTTFHVRRARAGEEQSLAWVIARFSPLLEVQARYRLRGRLRRLFDPEDLVADAWIVALPQLVGMHERDGRLTPVLLKFLSTTILNKINNALRSALRTGTLEPSRGERGPAPSLDGFPSMVTTALSAAERDEAREAIRGALEGLQPHEREVLILRGFEQVSNREAARILGIAPPAVSMRYVRALRRLRDRLPDSIFDELPEG